ncbi:hypothetical protein PR048_002963 [Dryococelus australis]|uniref:Reverse transcriptase/retrotransposon-derived protein RNase H-like domain-containing protein n=1 Tax=Dryococelus australis TaxID=614101 RepID=A0ABQ9ILU9_9NEOP|nr:hypothetical protein PR048_002963 [Dryococelus australis]
MVAEYRVRFLQVLHILGDAGFKVNSDKCVWQPTSIDALEFTLDAEGIQPTTDKTVTKYILAHYNPDLLLVVTAEASPVGIGAVLAHIIPGTQFGKTR